MRITAAGTALGVAAAVVGVSVSAAAAQPAQRARPAAEPHRYIHPADYPEAARAQNLRGTTAVRLTVGIDGRISACAVTRSSGSSLLDATTCRILRSRVRFQPARTGAGTPVEDQYETTVDWPPAPNVAVVNSPPPPVVTVPTPRPQGMNPIDATGTLARPRIVEGTRPRGDLQSLITAADYPASASAARQQGTTAVRLTVGVNGRVTGCTVTRSSGSSALDAATCRLLASRARFTPARDSNGMPATATHETTINWRLPRPR